MTSRSVSVALHVPGLASGIVGGGCCLLPLRTLVIDELASWPGVDITAIDDASEQVTAVLDPDATTRPVDLLDAIHDLGAADATLVGHRQGR